MACQHRYLIESPQQASERWERDGISAEDQSLSSACKLCGAQRDFPTDRQLDAQVDARDMHDLAFARPSLRHQTDTEVSKKLWQYINIEPMPPLHQPDPREVQGGE